MVDRSFRGLWTEGEWSRPVGATRIGESHIRQGIPNQDAFLLEQWPEQAATFVAISDGHGSGKYWRSDVGSQLAVSAFKELTEQRLLPLIRGSERDPIRIESYWEHAGRDIRQRWLGLAARHLQENPFTEDENQKAVNEFPDVMRRPIIVYGATLSGALLFREHGFFLHLGDADILTRGSGGAGATVFADPAIKSNETESLSQRNAHREILTRTIRGDEWKNTRFLLFSTDGVGDAFENDSAFHQHADQYLAFWRESGPEKTKMRIAENDLMQFTEHSGDDVTLVLSKRIEREDTMQRGEFEDAWNEFEAKTRARESQLISDIQKAADRAIERARELESRLRQETRRFEATESRLRELENFRIGAKWCIGILSATVVLGLGFYLISNIPGLVAPDSISDGAISRAPEEKDPSARNPAGREGGTTIPSSAPAPSTPSQQEFSQETPSNPAANPAKVRRLDSSNSTKGVGPKETSSSRKQVTGQ